MSKYFGFWNKKGKVWAIGTTGKMLFYPSLDVARAALMSSQHWLDKGWLVKQVGKNGYPVGDQDVHLTATVPIEREE